MEPWQSPTIKYRQQYLDPIDGMAKIRIAERSVVWGRGLVHARSSSRRVQHSGVSKPTYANLNVELFQSEKYLANLLLWPILLHQQLRQVFLLNPLRQL